MNYTTSPAGMRLIRFSEGCVLTAYNNSGNWTIGWGQEGALFPGTPGEIRVVPGLKITQKQADDALAFFVHSVVDPLVNEHFVCEDQAEHDACASWVYNVRHDKLRKGAYSLPSYVNECRRDPNGIRQITDKWLQYYKTPGWEAILYARRIRECLMFTGLPWDTPEVRSQIGLTPPGGDVDPIFAAAERTYDDLSENEKTAALNEGQREALGGKTKSVKVKGVPKARKPIETPKLPENPERKPIEQSTTGKGMAQEKAGRDQFWVGLGGTTMGGFAYVNNMTKGAKEMTSTAREAADFVFGISFHQVLELAGVVGIIWLVVGMIRWQTGRIRKAVGRREATMVKI